MKNYTFMSVLFILFTSSTDPVSSIPLPCQEPDNLYDIFMNLTLPEPLDYLLLPGINQSENYISAPIEQPSYINGTKDCPNSQTNVQVTATTPVSERSTCPFYFVSTFDSHRYPQHITEARCSCIKCLEYHGLSPRNYCEPMYRDMKVLVKTECINNVWQYSVGVYKKQESCTCAVPRQIQQEENNESHGDPTPM